MKGRALLPALSLACAAMIDGGKASAQSLTLLSVPSTATSQQFPQVTCTSTDAGVNEDILQLASDTRDQLGPILKLGSTWRFLVHIRLVMPDDPLAGRIEEERVAVSAAKETMTLEVALPYSDPDAKIFIQRQFVTALLWEKFFAGTKSFDSSTNLGVVPVWLIEGLNEWLTDAPGRDREGIVRRAASIRRAPSLKDVTGWDEISQDRLLGLYQRAFCYYLVNSLIHGSEKRADFQQWLGTFSSGSPIPAKFLFPTEAGWQQQLLDAPERSHDIVYTWDESSAALANEETIVVPGKKKDETRICTLDTVGAFPKSDQLVAALRKKVFNLTALELRAHPSWRPIFALYRFGLTALIDDHPDQAQTYIQQAQQQRVKEAAYHGKLNDYVNWFEVTKNYAGDVSHFDSYFSTARSMEEIQADPDHPNPIRAGLIQVESKL